MKTIEWIMKHVEEIVATDSMWKTALCVENVNHSCASFAQERN